MCIRDRVTTFLSENFCMVKGDTHAPPPAVAALMGIPSCKSSCEACKEDCKLCESCPLHHDRGDFSKTVGLFLQRADVEEKIGFSSRPLAR